MYFAMCLIGNTEKYTSLLTLIPNAYTSNSPYLWVPAQHSPP